MKKIYHKKITVFLLFGFLLSTIFITNLIGSVCGQDVDVKSPAREYNEDWNVAYGDSSTEVEIIESLGNTSDFLVTGEEYNGSHNIYSLARFNSTGHNNWCIEFPVYNSAPSSNPILGVVGSPDGNSIYALVRTVNSSSERTLVIYTISSNGTIISVEPLVYNNYAHFPHYSTEQIMLNPKNSSRLWIAYRLYQNAEKKLSYLVSYDLITHNLNWNHSLSGGDIVEVSSISYNEEYDRVFVLADLIIYPGAVCKSAIYKIEPEVGGDRSVHYITFEGEDEGISIVDFEIFENKIYIVAYNITASGWPMLFIVMDFAFENLIEIETYRSERGMYMEDILMFDKEHLIIIGYTRMDPLSPFDYRDRLYITGLIFDEDRQTLILQNTLYWGEYDKETRACQAIRHPTDNQSLLVVGRTKHLVDGEKVGFIAKFKQPFYYDASMSNEIPDQNEQDFFNFENFPERFLQQDWLIGTIMALSGFLVSFLLFRRKKNPKK